MRMIISIEVELSMIISIEVELHPNVPKLEIGCSLERRVSVFCYCHFGLKSLPILIVGY